MPQTVLRVIVVLFSQSPAGIGKTGEKKCSPLLLIWKDPSAIVNPTIQLVKKGRLTYPILDRGRLNRSLILSILAIVLNLVTLFSRRCIQRLNCFLICPVSPAGKQGT